MHFTVSVIVMFLLTITCLHFPFNEMINTEIVPVVESFNDVLSKIGASESLQKRD